MRTASILVGVLLLVGTSMCLCQTTMEEYNYITKGYKVQMESGLDMKKGYQFEDLNSSIFPDPGDSTTYKKTEFKALLREGQSTPCAIMCIFTTVTKSKIENADYICIPHSDSPKEIWSLAYDKVSAYSGEAAHSLLVGLMYLADHYATK